MADDFAEASIHPTDYALPPTHIVQALPDRYIRASVLTKTLTALWPNNWSLVTRLSYHIVIIPRKLTKTEIHALQKKSMKAVAHAPGPGSSPGSGSSGAPSGI